MVFVPIGGTRAAAERRLISGYGSSLHRKEKARALQKKTLKDPANDVTAV
jgi:hypothetical protein